MLNAGYKVYSHRDDVIREFFDQEILDGTLVLPGDHANDPNYTKLIQQYIHLKDQETKYEKVNRKMGLLKRFKTARKRY